MVFQAKLALKAQWPGISTLSAHDANESGLVYSNSQKFFINKTGMIQNYTVLCTAVFVKICKYISKSFLSLLNSLSLIKFIYCSHIIRVLIKLTTLKDFFELIN